VVVATPRTQTRHLLGRFSYGVTPALVKQADAAGGARRWFERQLNPSAIRDTSANAMRGWFPYLDVSAGDLYRADQSGEYPGWLVGTDLARWTILRRVHSRRQLHEMMTEFWSNLLHVPVGDDKSWPWRPHYDGLIRRHALGRFEDMLVTGTTHPAMGCFLDNAVSTKASVNENRGRELLELHTVGVDAGYGEDGVRSSAYVLTGWRLDMWDSWAPFYSADDHWRGPVRVLGFSDANDAADGREVTSRYLRYLANHPATAQRIARRLCVRFVSDSPSTRLVDKVARAFRSSGTDIKATLRTLVGDAEFADSVGAKVRTPGEDAVATYRALGLDVHKPRSDDDFANSHTWQVGNMGQRPFDWPAPNGFPDVGAAWSSVGRVLASWDAHLTLAGGWWPSKGVTYQPADRWVPNLPARFEDIVDHAARLILARPAGDAVKTAAAQFTGIGRRDRIESMNQIGSWRVTLMLAAILNSPAHTAR
jgi:hypothetical protein